jgi:hypothetical protein
VWVPTTRFASGDALGPVALVERTRSELVVRAVGPLRAFPVRARLALVEAGRSRVLVAEGERCAPGAGPGSCERAARLVPLVGDRFEPQPIAAADGACLSPSIVYLQRAETEPLEGGRVRRIELTASLAPGNGTLDVQELVVVREGAAGAASLARRAEDGFTVRLEGGRLVATGRPLWPRMRGAPRRPARRARR